MYSRIHVIQIVDAKQEELIQKALKRKLKASDLVDMDEDGDGYSKHIHPTHPAQSRVEYKSKAEHTRRTDDAFLATNVAHCDHLLFRVGSSGTSIGVSS